MTRSQSVAADQLTYIVETICSGTVFAGRRLCLKQIKKKIIKIIKLFIFVAMGIMMTRMLINHLVSSLQ